MGEMAVFPGDHSRTRNVNSAKTTASDTSSFVDARKAAVLEMTFKALEIKTKDHRVEERLRELSSSVLKARDDESRRIARELHDSVGQYLAALHMNLDALQQDTSAPLTVVQSKRISDSIQVVKQCTTEIRTMSYLLHPPLLDEMGLASALICYSEGFSARSGIRVELDISEEFDRLNPDTETAMFRIAQQGLANIHRHSGSPVAKIEIRQDAVKATMKISDEGHGMTPEAVRDFNSGTGLIGVGIAGMRERTRVMKGRFLIRSGQDGTIIEVSLPLSINNTARFGPDSRI